MALLTLLGPNLIETGKTASSGKLLRWLPLMLDGCTVMNVTVYRSKKASVQQTHIIH